MRATIDRLFSLGNQGTEGLWSASTTNAKGPPNRRALRRFYVIAASAARTQPLAAGDRALVRRGRRSVGVVEVVGLRLVRVLVALRAARRREQVRRVLL